jgi:hypothetical protein
VSLKPLSAVHCTSTGTPSDTSKAQRGLLVYQTTSPGNV